MCERWLSSSKDIWMGCVSLALNEVHVCWRLMSSVSADEYRAALAVLDEGERERAGKFAFAADRDLFVVSHALVRHTLSRYADVPPEGWRFVAASSGKPAIARQLEDRLTFNMAHTSGLTACAVARHDVGIDVESVDRRIQPLEIASRFFSPPELQWLKDCPEEQRVLRFIELWTLKEAYVKALGVGLSHALDTFGFSVEGDAIQFHPPDHDGFTWRFELMAPSERHRLAVAVRSPTPDPIVISLTPAMQIL
jgi:4'-phosphopantetheinyl transferase